MNAFRWFVFGYVAHIFVAEIATTIYERLHPRSEVSE